MFAERLKEARAAQNASLVAFAEKLGIGKTTLQKYEAGEGNPTLETVRLIAQRLERSPGYLLGLYSEEDILSATLMFRMVELAVTLPEGCRLQVAGLAEDIAATLRQPRGRPKQQEDGPQDQPCPAEENED